MSAENNKPTKNHCCFSYTLSGEYSEHLLPVDCPGILATANIDRQPDEGYYIEVCPRKSWLGRQAGVTAFSGIGPDLIVLHRDTIPTWDEYETAACEADEDW